MRVGLSRWAIKAHFSGRKDVGKLPERFRFARSLAIGDIGVVPFFDLQNLNQIVQHADTSLLRGGEHLLACRVGQETAKLKHLYPRRLLELDAMLRILVNRG